jgi:hypothetical protein
MTTINLITKINTSIQKVFHNNRNIYLYYQSTSKKIGRFYTTQLITFRRELNPTKKNVS